MTYDFSKDFPTRFCRFDLTSDQLYAALGLTVQDDGSNPVANPLAPRLIQLSAYPVAGGGPLRFSAVLEARREAATFIMQPQVGITPNFGDPFAIQNGLLSYNVLTQGSRLVHVTAYATTAQPFLRQLYQNQTDSQVQTIISQLTDIGYRLGWLCGYDPTGSSLAGSDDGKGLFDVIVEYTGGNAMDYVWGEAGENFAAQMQAHPYEQGWRLFNMQWYAYHGSQRFCAIWIQQPGPQWVVEQGLNRQELQTLLNELPGVNYRPDQMYGYQVNGETCYALYATAQTAAALYFQANYQGEPRVYYFDQPQVPLASAGQAQTISVELAPGTGASLYLQENYVEGPLPFRANIPSSTIVGSDASSPIGPWSLKLWPIASQPFRGGWAVYSSQGGYLNLSGAQLAQGLRGDWVQIRVAQALGPDRWLVTLGKNDGARTVYYAAGATTLSIWELPFGQTLATALPPGQMNLTLVAEGEHLFSLAINPDQGGPWLCQDLQLSDQYNDRLFFHIIMKYASAEALGALEPGEVALYNEFYFSTSAMYAAVFNSDYAGIQVNMQAFDPGRQDYAVRSVELGPQTAVTLFAGANFDDDSPKMDLLTSTTDLSGAAVKIVQSLKPYHVVTPGAVGLTVQSSLSEDYRTDSGGNLESYSAYRATITFPQTVGTVKIWATEAAEIEVDGKTFLVDETQSVTLTPNPQSQLVITMDAEKQGLSTPGIKLQTDTMKVGERVVIHPDEEVHQRLATLKDNDAMAGQSAPVPELYAAAYTPRDMSDLLNVTPQPLINQTKYSAADIGNVQTAIKQIASSVSYAQAPTTIGQSTSRTINGNNMTPQNWLLDLGVAPFAGVGQSVTPHSQPVGNLAFTALSPTGSAADAGSVAYYRQNAQPFDQALAQGLFSSVRHLGSDIGHGLRHAANEATDAATGAADTVAHGLKQLKDDVQNGVKQVSHVVITMADVVKGGVQAIIHYIENDIQQAVTFVVNTARRAARLVEVIVQQIGATVSEFLMWLRFLFEWQDILRTQRVLVDSFNNAMTFLQNQVTSPAPKVDGFFASIRDHLSNAMDGLIGTQSANAVRQQQGLAPVAGLDAQFATLQSASTARLAAGPQGATQTMAPAMEKIGWALSKMSDHDSSSGGASGASGSADSLMTLVTNIVNRLQNDSSLKQSFPAAYDYFRQTITHPNQAPEMMISGLLEATKGVALATVDILDGLVIDFLNVARLVIQAFQDAVNASWNIPILSPLFKLLTRSELTLLDFGALLLAIPVTVISKVILGQGAPFQNYSALQLGNIGVQRDWDIAYACGAFALALLSPTNDLLNFLGGQPQASGGTGPTTGPTTGPATGAGTGGGTPAIPSINTDADDEIVTSGIVSSEEESLTSTITGGSYGTMPTPSASGLRSFGPRGARARVPTQALALTRILTASMMKLGTYTPLWREGSDWDKALWSYRWGLIGYDGVVWALNSRASATVQQAGPYLATFNSLLGLTHLGMAALPTIFDDLDLGDRLLRFEQWFCRALPRSGKFLGIRTLVEETYGATLIVMLGLDLFDIGTGLIALQRTGAL